MSRPAELDTPELVGGDVAIPLPPGAHRGGGTTATRKDATVSKASKVKKKPVLVKPRAKVESLAEVRAALNEPATTVAGARGSLEASLKLIDEAYAKLEIGVHCLRDSKRFFDAMDPTERIPRTKAINDYYGKLQFALHSLRDELKISLNCTVDELAPLAELGLSDKLRADEGAETVMQGQRASAQDVQTLKVHFDRAATILARHECAAEVGAQLFESAKFFFAQAKSAELQLLRLSEAAG